MPSSVEVRALRVRTAWRWPLVMWHLLSLDAPTVAALWTAAVARSVRLRLPASSVEAMFVAVWMLYAADRLLDAAAEREKLEARHRFHARHRGAFLTGLGIAAVLLIGLLPQLPSSALRLYAQIAAALVVWFTLIHLPPARRLPKELAVGVFFAAATWVPTVAREPALRLSLVAPAVLFAALCSLNCLYIYRWEHPVWGFATESHATTRVLLRHLPAVLALVGGLALTLAVFTQSALALSVAASAGLLAALDRWRPREPSVLRACADLVLLTPAVWMR